MDPELPDLSEDTSELEAERLDFIRRHNPLSLNELTDSAPQIPPWLIENFLLSRSITMISGEPYVGKTFFALNLALVAASGHHFINPSLRAPARVGTAFFGQNAPTWDYHAQVQKLWKGFDPQPSITASCLFFLNKGISLTDHQFISFAVDLSSTFGIKLFVFDTLRDFHDLDENDNRAMSHLFDIFKQLRDKHQISIAFTHHTSKPTEIPRSANYRSRGSTTIAGDVDQHILLTSFTNRVGLSFPKGRGQSAASPIIKSFVLKDLIIADKPAIQLISYETDNLTDQILAILATAPTAYADIRSQITKLYPTIPPSSLTGRINGSLRYLSNMRKAQKSESGLWTLASQEA